MKKIYLLLVAIIVVALVWAVARRKPEITEKPKNAQEYFETGVNSYKNVDISTEEYREMTPEEKEEYNKMVISSTDSAIKSHQEIIDKYPESKWADDAQFSIGAAYYIKALVSNGDNADKAIEASQKFITDYPEAKLEPYTIENSPFIRGFVSKAVSSQPHAFAQWQIANIYEKIKKDYPQAAIEYTKVIDNYPQSTVAQTTIYSITALCPKLNDYTPAIEACQKLLKTRTNISPGETVWFKKVIKDSKAKQAALKALRSH